jgi:hypothetical protein
MLDCFGAVVRPGDGVRGDESQSLDEGDFERQLRVGRVLDGKVDLTKSSRQPGQLREREHPGELTRACICIAGGAGSFEQEKPQIGEKLPVELARIFAFVDRVLDHA